MSSIADLSTKIDELVAAEKAESVRVAAAQKTAQDAIDALSAKLTAALAAGVPVDASADIAKVQAAINDLDATDAPAPAQ